MLVLCNFYECSLQVALVKLLLKKSCGSCFIQTVKYVLWFAYDCLLLLFVVFLVNDDDGFLSLLPWILIIVYTLTIPGNWEFVNRIII